MNRISSLIVAVGVAMGILISSGNADQHWPEEVQGHVQTLAELVSPEIRARAREMETREIGAKLIVLAEYKAEHADRIDAVIDSFVTGPGTTFPTRVAPKPPKITPEWADDQYRLAWEYLLLRPRVLDRFIAQRAGTALADINHPASALTIATSIRTSLAKDSIPGRFRDLHQRAMLDALADMPGNISLEALMAYPEWLEASRAIDAVEGELPESRRSDLDLPGYPTRALRESIRVRPESGWQELLRNPPSTLTPRQLERVRELRRTGGDVQG